MEQEKEPETKMRCYQTRLLKVAIKQNSIIYLPTGSGKTLIAIMLIKAMSKQMNGTLQEGGKRTVFICNTITLAHQQMITLKKCTNFKCGLITGEQNVSFWTQQNWIQKFNDCQVLVATCQVIVDILKFNYINLSNINLLIFDECHHAFGDHPMHQLMNEFKNANPKDYPRVLGLTAILIKTSSKDVIFQDLFKLEATFRGKIITVENLNEYKNVLLYSTKPTELIITHTNFKICGNVYDKIKLLIEDCMKKIESFSSVEDIQLSKGLNSTRLRTSTNDLKLKLSDFLFQMDYFGLYGASIAILAVIVDLEKKRLTCETMAFRNFVRMCLTLCERINHIIVTELDVNDQNKKDKLFKYSSNKICCLLLYVYQQFVGKAKDEIKCLAFVNRRTTAKCLFYVMKDFVECCESLAIVPDFITGVNSGMNYSIEDAIKAKIHQTVMNNFKKNKTNFLIASSVLEEGIDIQSCNYVFSVDDPKTFLSYVQSKGRARQTDSNYCILIEKTKVKKTNLRLAEYKEIDEMLKGFLIHKTIDLPVNLEIKYDADLNKIIPPYVTKSGARVDHNSALSLFHRYIEHLTTDRYNDFPLMWSSNKLEDGNVIVELNMPLMSTVKNTIYSFPHPNVQIGKKYVALEAIKLLHKNGEINDTLLPISNTECIKRVDPKYFEHWNQYKNDNPKIAGTNKMVRLHDIHFPEQLVNGLPKVNEPCQIYLINIVPSYKIEQNDDYIYSLLKTNSSYAILTSKTLPKIAKMPLYMSQGELLAEISSEPFVTVIHAQEDIDALRKFHVMIFRDVLNIWKTFFANNYQNHLNSFLIVPMRNRTQIDWNMVKQFPNLTKMSRPSADQQSNNLQNANDYVGKTISSWYSLEETRYMVKNMCSELTPSSKFPNESFNLTFAEYFESKYTLKVTNMEQNLIEVQPFTQRINFILPGTVKNSSKAKLNIRLIPELCHNFMYPSHMWLKAFFLPTILHRLHFILIAENLRLQINKQLNINNCDYMPKEIIVDYSLPRVYCTDEKIKEQKTCPSANSVEVTKCKDNDQNSVFLDSVWEKHKLPVDIDHNLKKLYAAEISYYIHYINNTLNDVDKIDLNYNNDNMSSENPISGPSGDYAQLPAIKDTAIEEKLKIKILDIKLNDSDIKSAEQFEILSAITTAKATDAFDMERFEVLGDSFLKFHISLFLLHNHQTWNEGYLTAVKGKFVSNQNLLYCANLFDLPSRLNTLQFDPRGEWLPPLISVPDNCIKLILENNISSRVLYKLDLSESEIASGVCNDQNLEIFHTKFRSYKENVIPSDLNIFINKQAIADKTCADAMEALIGVCVKNYGIERTFKVIDYMGILPKGSSKLNLLEFKNYSPLIKANISSRDVDALLINYNLIEEKLNYTFKDRAFLLQALTHPSFGFNRITGCYQQLEFIGDALLDFLVSCYIFERATDMNPGKLTDLRSSLVNNCTLATLSVRNNFHLHLLSNNVALSEAILKFDSFSKTQKYRVTDNVRILLSEDEVESKMIADCIDVPKALGDIFESIIGAIFFDSGNDLKVTWNVIYHLMSFEIHEFMVNTPIQLVRQLIEYKGANPIFGEPTILENICMIKCSFQCLDKEHTVNGFGKNKNDAKLAAAKLALKVLLHS